MDDLRRLREYGELRAPADPQPPAELRHRVLNSLTTMPRQPRSQQRTWRPRIAVTAALVIAAAAAAVAVAVPMLDQTEAPSQQMTSHRVLQLAAQLVAGTPARAARGDQLIYTESTVVYQDIDANGWRVSFSPKTVVRQWRSVDGSREGLILTKRLDVADGPWLRERTPRCTANCAVDPRYGGMPETADQLYAYLYRPGAGEFAEGYGPDMSADERALGEAAYLLYLGQHEPAAQAAVFQAIARIPAVTVRQTTVDVLGRPGVGLVHESGTAVTELIFDPKTYRYLGMNRTITHIDLVSRSSDGPRGITIRAVAQEAVQQVAIVDNVGDTGGEK